MTRTWIAPATFVEHGPKHEEHYWDWMQAKMPRPCPSCRQFKQGDGRLCTVCAREARIQLEEDNKL